MEEEVRYVSFTHRPGRKPDRPAGLNTSSLWVQNDSLLKKLAVMNGW